tara:strand:+ start:1026 stop:1172 length:147 start_codon:yes stop_codon:yes gene_type:complete
MSISTKALRRSLFVATSVGAIAISSPAMAETCFSRQERQWHHRYGHRR